MEAFDLAAGLRVVGPGVSERDAAGVQGDLERDSAVAAVAAGEDGPVVAEQAGRIPIGGNGFAEAGLDVGAFEHASGVAGQAQPGVVVDQVQDLDVAAVGQGASG